MHRIFRCILMLPLLAGNAFAHDDADHSHEDHVAQVDHVHVVQMGSGDNLYETVPGWGNLPDGKPIGPTHGGVVVDPQTGLVYVSTDAQHSILVFRADGAFVKSLAPEFRGLHSMDVAVEEGETVLYGAQLSKANPRLCKIDTEGTLLLEISADSNPDLPGGWRGITGVAVAPDGTIFCSMGYGSNMIHKFDANGAYLDSFGGKGAGAEVLTKTSHGLKVDLRFGEPRLIVCDRENRRLFHTTLDGEWIGEIATGLRRPCSVSILGDLCAVAELEGRVTLLDKEGDILTHLGDNPNKRVWAKFRIDPAGVEPNLFMSPHGLSFDSAGNLYVQDWNRSGRLTKLAKRPNLNLN